MKNPKQCAQIIHKAQQLIVENKLCEWNQQANDPTPMSFYHENFALFKIAIINEHKGITINIRPSEIPGIIKKSNYALKKHMDSMYDSAATTDLSTEPVSLAYTVRFGTGTLKGKTPAEVLLEDPKGTDTLNNQYAFLKKNADKYPKNREIMKAIVEAAKLLKEGKLQKNTAIKLLPIIELYNSSFRPLIRKQREDGKSPVSEAKIFYSVGEKYPVTMEIQQYYAKVEKRDNGTLNVIGGTRADSIKNTIRLSMEEWEYVLYTIQTGMRTFENSIAAKCYKIANDMEINNIQNAK